MTKTPEELKPNFKLTLVAKCKSLGHPLDREEFASMVEETFKQGCESGSHFSYCNDMQEVWVTVNGSQGATTIITPSEKEWIESLVPELQPVK